MAHNDNKPNEQDIKLKLTGLLGDFDPLSVKVAIEKDIHIEQGAIEKIIALADSFHISVTTLIPILKIIWTKIEAELSDKEGIKQMIAQKNPRILEVEGFDEYMNKSITRIYNALYDFVWEDGYKKYESPSYIIKKKNKK